MKLRNLNRAIALAEGYFWLPCPVCGQEFGGHEWLTEGQTDGLPASVPDPDARGMSFGICPDCTWAGYGYPYEVASELWGMSAEQWGEAG